MLDSKHDEGSLYLRCFSNIVEIFVTTASEIRVKAQIDSENAWHCILGIEMTCKFHDFEQLKETVIFEIDNKIYSLLILAELCNSKKKRQHYCGILKAFVVRRIRR